MLQINFTNIKIRKRKTSAETKVEEKKIEGLKQVGPLEPKERHFEERSLPKNTDEEIKLVEPEEDEKAKLTKHANAKELESKRKNPEEKNKDVHIKLHIKSDNDFKDLLLDIYFDKNAPNIFTNGDAVRWHPTVEEMDSVLEAFDIISQPLTNPGKKIDDLSKKFYFYDKKNKNDQPISDLKPDETDKSGIKNTYDYTFKKEGGKTPKEPKIPEFLEEPSNEKPERTTEEQKIKEIEEKEPNKQPESEENRKDEKPTKPENNHFQETDETEEIVLTPPAKSAKTEEIIFNPEQTKIDEPTSDSKQDDTDERLRLDKVLFSRVKDA